MILQREQHIPFSIYTSVRTFHVFSVPWIVTMELKISIWYYFVTAILLMIVWIKHMLWVRHPTYVICMYYLSEARTNLVCLGVSFSFFFLSFSSFFFLFRKWKKSGLWESSTGSKLVVDDRTMIYWQVRLQLSHVRWLMVMCYISRRQPQPWCLYWLY